MKKVIIRADRAGVSYGELVSKEICGDKLMVEMKNCRRIFYWSGAASLSQLATEGTKRPNDCKFTVQVKSTLIMGVIEIIPCTKEAISNLDSVREWKL